MVLSNLKPLALPAGALIPKGATHKKVARGGTRRALIMRSTLMESLKGPEPLVALDRGGELQELTAPGCYCSGTRTSRWRNKVAAMLVLRAQGQGPSSAACTPPPFFVSFSFLPVSPRDHLMRTAHRPRSFSAPALQRVWVLLVQRRETLSGIRSENLPSVPCPSNASPRPHERHESPRRSSVSAHAHRLR